MVPLLIKGIKKITKTKHKIANNPKDLLGTNVKLHIKVKSIILEQYALVSIEDLLK